MTLGYGHGDCLVEGIESVVVRTGGWVAFVAVVAGEDSLNTQGKQTGVGSGATEQSAAAAVTAGSSHFLLVADTLGTAVDAEVYR